MSDGYAAVIEDARRCAEKAQGMVDEAEATLRAFGAGRAPTALSTATTLCYCARHCYEHALLLHAGYDDPATRAAIWEHVRACHAAWGTVEGVLTHIELTLASNRPRHGANDA